MAVVYPSCVHCRIASTYQVFGHRELPQPLLLAVISCKEGKQLKEVTAGLTLDVPVRLG
jgi:hypothetical protein